MGSNNSRRRTMSGRNSRDVEDDSDDGARLRTGSGNDPTDLATILSYLIRSGQVQILSSDRSREDSDDNDDEDDYDGFDGDSFFSSGRCPPPSGEGNPDLTEIEKSELKQVMSLESGQVDINKKKMSPSIPRYLFKRESGKRKIPNFSHSDRCAMGARFLPNDRTTVAQYHHKAFCGLFSGEGDIFLSAAQDQRIRIYDSAKGQFRLSKTICARDMGWSVLDTAFSPDGHYLIYSSWSDNVHLCNLRGDYDTHIALNFCPNDGRFCVFSLAFSEDNTEILGGANDGCLYVFNRERNERTMKIDSHDDDVNAVAFADISSQILFSGGDDGLCKVWDRRTLSEEDPVPVGVLAGHSDGITYIDSKGDARYLISNSKDQTIKMWDVRKFSTSEAQEATKHAVASQRWDYRWQRVPKRVVRQKSLTGDTSLMTYRGHSVLHTLIRCHFSPQFSTAQRYIYTGCASGSVVIYDTLTGKIVTRLNGHSHCVRDVSWHPYDNIIMSTSWDGTVGKWEYKTRDAYSDSDSDSDESLDGNQKRRRRSKRNKLRNSQRCERPRRFRNINL